MSGSRIDGAPLLTIEDLRVSFATRRGVVEAVRGIDLTVAKGEILGIVGESGSGKSVTAFSVMQLLDRAARITRGTIRFRGQDITRLGTSDLRQLRGAEMSMIFQNPRGCLNPIRPVGEQISDALRAHRGMTRAEARTRALALLEAVLIREAERRLDAYPHELSGGMCQRVMMAMAMACEPDLLIADEPTTGLDVTTQKTVMDQLAAIVRERGMAMILITHDLGLASMYCDRVAVMEQGLIVETAASGALFGAPKHAYTKRLVAASPTPTSTVESLSPDFAHRSPPLRAITAVAQPPLLSVENLVKRFDGGVAAVDGVSFAIGAGESLGLVGESGSGKSTISRIVCRLIDATSGAIQFEGRDIGAIPARGFHKAPERASIQIVFQDPGDSLNPRFSAFDSIADPLRRLKRISDGRNLREQALDCASRCGLPSDLMDRFPHQLSGGQRARVGIARAIAAQPKLLILDEPTAALDVSVQALILQLLDKLRREEGMAYLFVSHDLNVIRMMCERTIVLKEGRVVEQGSSDELFARPTTDYTRDLLAAIPHFDPSNSKVSV